MSVEEDCWAHVLC